MEKNIEYIKIFMEYESSDMPVVYVYEVDLDDERLALRAIEVFHDRQLRKMEDLYYGAIEILPIPTADELNAKVWGDEFHALVIPKEEFEEIWESSTYHGDLS